MGGEPAHRVQEAANGPHGTGDPEDTRHQSSKSAACRGTHITEGLRPMEPRPVVPMGRAGSQESHDLWHHLSETSWTATPALNKL